MNGHQTNYLQQVKPLTFYMFNPSILRDFRSDHAGEVGAVFIYKGILKSTNDPILCAFAKAHLQQEAKHLEFFEQWLPKNLQSVILPIWRVAGFALGYLPAKLGRNWVFITISAVENFVIKHYHAQINYLEKQSPEFDDVIRILKTFREDESEHFDDAKHRAYSRVNAFQKLWQNIVDIGSRVAVTISRVL